MTTQETIAMFKEYVIANYGRVDDVIVKGSGSTIWNADGRKILDMFPGWAVSGIGHCHPKVVAALQEQAAKLIHIDNTFYSEPQGQLAKMLSERAFGGKCFFCNSGAEAVEAALKLSRLHTAEGKYKIISAIGGFHGRTLGAITATAQPKYHKGFLPLLPGFVYIPFNDIGALEQAFDDETAAVIIEPVQGEGGVKPASKEYLQAVRSLCDSHGAVAIFDEVQTGMGRTGKWFAHQHYGIEPDIMTMAKALGGGVSIGAIMAQPDVAASLVPGTHASTFGGNPLACAAGIAVIQAIEEENLLDNSNAMSQLLIEKLTQLQSKHTCIREIRAMGLMVGIELNQPGASIVQAAWAKGMRINCTQDTTLRMTPAMNVTAEQIEQAVTLLDEALTEVVSA